jgi:hypothetical protein
LHKKSEIETFGSKLGENLTLFGLPDEFSGQNSAF